MGRAPNPGEARDPVAHEEQLRAWVAAYGPALRRYFQKRVGPAEAEDLVQDVFVAMQVRGAIDDPEKVDRYLFRVAAHILARRRQRQGWNWAAHAELGDLDGPPDELSPERILIANERLSRLTSPTISWDAAKRLWGDDGGFLAADLSLSASALFGRQETRVTGQDLGSHYDGRFNDYQLVPPITGPAPVEQPRDRSNSAVVPSFGATLGLSYSAQRVKITTGYRWERYFDALDAGYREEKQYDRTFDGPFLKLSVGFGG